MWVILIAWMIIIYTLHKFLFIKYKSNQYGKPLTFNALAIGVPKHGCSKTRHKTFEDCLNSWSKKDTVIDGPSYCKTQNLLYYTRYIRRGINRQQMYENCKHDLIHLLKSSSYFPYNCRIIGSMLTNIFQCSLDRKEAAYAQAINMFIQYEKLNLLYNGIRLKTKTPITGHLFEGNDIENSDLFSNVYHRDLNQMYEQYGLVTELYIRAIRLLKSEPSSILNQIYLKNKPGRESIDNILRLETKL